nr:hypothetical protein [Micromonospora sp. DSM 115978]
MRRRPTRRPLNRGPIYPDEVGERAAPAAPTLAGPGSAVAAVDSLSHLPRRPLWLCRVCAADWPCGPARLNLLREHGDDPVWLRVYLASAMHEALRDLVRLNPDSVPTPDVIWRRFLAWAAPADK